MSFANATLTTDPWATGGKPGIRSKTFTDPGKPFQEGWDSVPEAGTKGSNKPTAPRNYRVAYPFNVLEYNSPGEDFHKFLEHHFTFIVYDDKFMSKDRFEKFLEKDQQGKRNVIGSFQRRNVAVGPIVPLRNLPATNYSLVEYSLLKRDSSIFEILKRVHPLAIPHNPKNTTEAYPRGSHVHNHTLVGSIDMYNFFPTATSRNSVNEGDYLFFILKKIPLKSVPAFDFNGDKKMPIPIPAKPEDANVMVWQFIPWSCGNNSPSPEDIKYVDNDDGEERYGAFYRVCFVEELVLTEQVRANKTLTIQSTFETKRTVNYNSVYDIMQQPIIRVKVDQAVLPQLV